MKRRHILKIRKGEIILPEGFSAGPVGRLEEEKCLFVIPRREGNVLALSNEERDFIEVTGKVLIAYCLNYFEIWNPCKFAEFEKETSMEKLVERLGIAYL